MKEGITTEHTEHTEKTEEDRRVLTGLQEQLDWPLVVFMSTNHTKGTKRIPSGWEQRVGMR